ncbi:MAG TPA: hypothetical protein VG500_20990 [Gemmatimonadales bacterium]|jgi:hypothetical protein|nr:hypothetical protein [Gemmatimonadales bacterium]
MDPAYGSAAALALLAIASACGEGPSQPEYDPQLDPADFVAAVTNPLFPLAPGTTYHFEGETAEGVETIVTEVLADTRTILGITATIVHDRVFLDGDLIEDTFDWYAQQDNGDVWYLGEDSREIEDGEVVSTEGSWEAGLDGAKPGIIMWGDPAAHLNEEYRQEYYQGVAEDVATVIALDEEVEVPHGRFTGCLRTEDRNPLEPGAVEHKFYCPGIGLTLEGPADGSERFELIGITGP